MSLVLPKVREACPHNLAPTTSTLLQLAMGDALAVALLQKKGLAPRVFTGFIRVARWVRSYAMWTR